jgi:hypothetical protein
MFLSCPLIEAWHWTPSDKSLKYWRPMTTSKDSSNRSGTPTELSLLRCWTDEGLMLLRQLEMALADELRTSYSSTSFEKSTRKDLEQLVPTTRARPNSQTLLTSNAGDAFSVVLNGMRERALENPPKSFGFYEYSAPQYCKITDRQGWAQANPALGFTISEEALEEAVATSPIENTRTELLCQWIDSLSSPWPHGVLEETSDSSLTIPIGGYTVFAFDVISISPQCELRCWSNIPDGRIGVGILQTWESQVSVDDLKIAAEIKAWADQYRPRSICFDKYTAQTIADRLTNAGCSERHIRSSLLSGLRRLTR